MSLLDDAVRRRQSDPNGEAPELLERFVSHRALAARLAYRYHRSSNPTDLGQVADIALLLASRRYEPSRGPFERFAIVTIVGELKKHLRRTAWNVHVPRRTQEDALTVQAAIDRLSVEFGRSPRLSEVARASDLPVERVSQALRARNARFAAEEPDPDRSTASGATDDPADGMDVRRAVDGLCTADRALVALAFDRDFTQRDIAARLGISQSQVQRRLKRALAEVHTGLGGAQRSGAAPSQP